MVTLSEVYTGNNTDMQERVTSVDWAPSRDGSKNIPLITSPHCKPDMQCQKVKYVSKIDVSGDGSTFTKCTPTPGGGENCITVDPYPICNGDVTKDEDVMDCANKPCTCRSMDYKYVFFLIQILNFKLVILKISPYTLDCGT